MPEKKTFANGTFSWADLQTPSVDGAKKFYSSLFGWDHRDKPTPQGGAYTMFTMRGQNLVGMGEQPPEMKGSPAFWTSYVNVDNVDRIGKLVTENGGKVALPPMDVMEEGRMMMLQDPTGAMLGCWQPKAHQGTGIQREVGALCWFELMTSNTAAAKTFYSNVFGWKYKESKDASFEYNEIQQREEALGGIMPMPAGLPAGVPPCWLPYFAVTDCAATCAKATQLGGKVQMQPQTIANVGTFAVLIDPQGGAFDIIAPMMPK